MHVARHRIAFAQHRDDADAERLDRADVRAVLLVIEERKQRHAMALAHLLEPAPQNPRSIVADARESRGEHEHAHAVLGRRRQLAQALATRRAMRRDRVGDRERLSIAAHVVAARGATLPQGLRDARHGSQQRLQLKPRFACQRLDREIAAHEHRQRLQRHHRRGHARIRHAAPQEQVLVATNRVVDVAIAKRLATGAAMLVHHGALRREQHAIAALPRLVGQPHVFDVERVVEGVEAADLQEHPAIKRSAAAASPQGWHILELPFVLARLRMRELEPAALDRSTRAARFFAALARVAEEHFGCDAEHVGLAQAFEQRPQEAWLHDHVVVEEHEHIARRRRHACRVAAHEVAILGQRDHLHPRMLAAQPLDGAVVAAVVDDDHLVIAAA